MPEGGIFRVRRAMPFRVWTVEAMRRVTSAAVEVPAAKACQVAVEVSVEGPVAAEVLAVEDAVAAVAAEGGRHAKI